MWPRSGDQINGVDMSWEYCSGVKVIPRKQLFTLPMELLMESAFDVRIQWISLMECFSVFPRSFSRDGVRKPLIVELTDIEVVILSYLY